MGTPSTTPFFGRAYQLSVQLTNGDIIIISSDAWEPESLRFTFDIHQLAFGAGSAFWFADVEIYNCDGPIPSGPSSGVNLAQTVIAEGNLVTVSAGYQADGTPQVIWKGQLLQSIWERVDVIDYKLTLRCIIGRAFTSQNFINRALSTISTARQQAEYIAQNSLNIIPLNSTELTVLDQVAPGQLPGAKTYFGNPHNYLDAIARNNGMLSWIAGDGYHMAPVYNPTDPTTASTALGQTANGTSLPVPVGKLLATYGPCTILGGPPVKLADGTTLSLIGRPQQTQYGVNFTVLLDSRLQIVSPLPQVRLSSAFVRQAPIAFGSLPPYPLSADGLYVIVGVRHYGDTRGNPWYTEVTAFSQIQNVIALLGPG